MCLIIRIKVIDLSYNLLSMQNLKFFKIIFELSIITSYFKCIGIVSETLNLRVNQSSILKKYDDVVSTYLVREFRIEERIMIFC